MRKKSVKFQIQKNRILFENGQSFLYTKEMVKRFALFDRQALSEEDYEALVRYRMQLSAYTWLSKRDYFQRELEQKLIREYGHRTWARELIEKLEEQAYLDDYNLACAWIRTKNYGKQKLAFFVGTEGLRQKPHSRGFARGIFQFGRRDTETVEEIRREGKREKDYGPFAKGL